MLKYILRKIALVIPTVVVVIFTIFVILNITPGDPGRIILGQNAPQEAVDELNHSLGADRPMLERFGRYMADVVRLDFGKSYRTGDPVFEDIFAKFPTTLKLGILTVLVSTVIGIPLGILSAVKQYSVLDYSLTVTSLLLASVPNFFLALILILVFSLWLRVLPSNGIDSLKSYILPVVTLSLPQIAMLSRYTRTSMLETMRQDYIRTAKAKGAGKTRVIWKHALKPAMMPIVTVSGMTFAATLGGAIIAETVYGLPGIGSLILTSTQMKDAPVILGASVFLAVMYKLIMLLVDIMQIVIDPRLKSEIK